jgi:hypothetical protein
VATVGTSTQTDILSYPSIPSIVRDVGTNVLKDRMYAVVRTAADTLTVYRTTNEGTSWASFTSITHTGLQEWSRLVVDKAGWAHLAYRVNAASTDTLWYRRLGLSDGVWSPGLQVSGSPANGGVAGARFQGVDLAVHRHADGAYAIVVFGAFTDVSARYGLYAHGVSISKGGTIYSNNGLISGNRVWLQAGTAPGRAGVTAEIEHTGDGISSSTPHIWASYGRTALRMVRLAWKGSTSGSWTGPANFQTLRTNLAALDYLPARWDGKQWLTAVISPDDATVVRVFQRNQANTVTTTFDTPTHPTGNIRHLALSYDNATKDVRVFAVGTSTGVLYYCDYTRATSVWTAWATVTATAIGPGVGEWGVRAGGTADNARHDVLTTASGSPNTVSHTGMSASSVPNIATWTPSSTFFNGGARDVGVSLTLDWDFADPDPGQTQGSYAVSRQIGAGVIQYWRASDSTWQASEVQNPTATTALILAAGWGVNGDLPHTYKVKVWDSANVPAVAYSDPYVVVPSVPVNPAITAPTAAQVITTDQVTVTWTAAEQTAWRIQLDTNPATGVVYDSGWVAETATTSHTIPTVLGNGTAWQISLQTRNLEGLPSAVVTRALSVAYNGPPAAISTFVASTSSGTVTVTSSVLAPVGAQPAVTSMDLYRRPVTTSTLNSNPTFAGNTTGYLVGGGSGGTLTYSTVQSAPGSSPGSARLVPGGAGATPSIESAHVPIDTSRAVHGSAWIRPDTANKPITLNINWYTSGSVYISTASVQITVPVAAAWQFLEIVADPTAVPTAARASISAGLTGTPAAGDAIYADELRLRQHDTTSPDRVVQAVPSPAVVADWGAASGITYEYRWVTTGANGTTTVGPWMS